MSQQVQVDGVGLVEFADDFTSDEIQRQVDNIYARQELGAAQKERPAIERRLQATDIAERTAQGLTLPGLASTVAGGTREALRLLGMQGPDVPMITPEAQQALKEAIEQNPVLRGSILGAMPELPVRILSAVSAPEIAATLPALRYAAHKGITVPEKLAGAGFATVGAADLPRAIEAYKSAPAAEKTGRGADVLLDILLAALPFAKVPGEVAKAIKAKTGSEWIPSIPETGDLIPETRKALEQTSAGAATARRLETERPVEPAAPTVQPAEEVTPSAEAIRSRARQPEETRLGGERGEADRGNVVEQTPPEQPKPVAKGEALATARSLRPPPELLTPEAFQAAAESGKIHQATGKETPAEQTAKTPLTRGEAAGYSSDDIAAFYVLRGGGWRRGAYELVKDAQSEGRPINARLWDDVVTKPPKGYIRDAGVYRPAVASTPVQKAAPVKAPAEVAAPDPWQAVYDAAKDKKVNVQTIDAATGETRTSSIQADRAIKRNKQLLDKLDTLLTRCLEGRL